MLDGLIGDDQERDEAAGASIPSRIWQALCSPQGCPGRGASCRGGRDEDVPVGKGILIGRQGELRQQSSRRQSVRALLRYCRVDRARFVYPENGGLSLQFEGVTVRPVDIRATLLDESRRLFLAPPRGIRDH